MHLAGVLTVAAISPAPGPWGLRWSSWNLLPDRDSRRCEGVVDSFVSWALAVLPIWGPFFSTPADPRPTRSVRDGVAGASPTRSEAPSETEPGTPNGPARGARDGGSVPLDVRSIHAAHAELVWASLQRMGVREADLEDALQEVFIVVHRRLDSFDGSSRLTTWLFGIAMRVASAFRRRAHVRREQVVDEVPEPAGAPTPTAEDALAMKQARATLDEILDGMDVERRAVFVMFEVEELGCDEIAKVMGVPIGTIYSRLHKARKEFDAGLHRLRAREGSRLAQQRAKDRAKTAAGGAR